MSIENAIASLAVADLATAIRWYEQLFGRGADSRPVPEVAEWRFPRGGWLQVYESAERAGGGSLTLAVTSVEEQLADLQRCGIEPGPPIITPTMKVVMIEDPDGNSIAFAETLAPLPEGTRARAAAPGDPADARPRRRTRTEARPAHRCAMPGSRWRGHGELSDELSVRAGPC